MHLGPTFALAVRRLLHRPVRSFLLLQGTVWGVAVAVFPSAVIEGTRQAGTFRASSLGSDRISIAPDPTKWLPSYKAILTWALPISFCGLWMRPTPRA